LPSAIEPRPTSRPCGQPTPTLWYAREFWQRSPPHFSAALARDPDFCVALRDRGLARYLMGDHEKALADLDEAGVSEPL